jgi:phosphatidate phosphatase PAH1
MFLLLLACTPADLPSKQTTGTGTDSTQDSGTDSGTTATTGKTGATGGTTGGTTGDTSTGTTTTTACTPADDQTRTAVVTDIDETLTTDDNEFLLQIVDPSHDPEMRPDANTLMNAYHDLGYRIFYVTARGDGLILLDGTSATDATTEWLTRHNFPFNASDVFLADGVGAFSSSAADYKTGVMQTLQDYGFDLVWAYGNADTDVEAYQNVGIPDDHIFLVGDLAGQYGVEPISNEDAYTNHMAQQIPLVPCGS